MSAYLKARIQPGSFITLPHWNLSPMVIIIFQLRWTYLYFLLNVRKVYSSFIQIYQYNKNKFLYMISSLTILHWCQNPCLLCHKNHNFSRMFYGFFNIQSVCMHCQQNNRFLIFFSNILYELFGPTLL